MKGFDEKEAVHYAQRCHASISARINAFLTTKTKRELRDELAEAVRNTSALPIPTEGETDASDH